MLHVFSMQITKIHGDYVFKFRVVAIHCRMG
jgi:hypothetical protein